MKLEVGKYYKTRDGQKVGPLSVFEAYDKSEGFGSGEMAWWPDGSYSKIYESDEDLVAEWADTPEIGTLAETGAQVGDVVEWLGVELRTKEYVEHRISEISDGEYYNHEGVALDEREVFRIISRASDAQPSPVITETVKRIVPGVYAGFYIGHSYDGEGKLIIGMSNSKDDTMHTFDRADLIAARDVFTQLIDAMPQE